MKRVIPKKCYEGKPCSVVAVGSALGLADRASISGLKSPQLHEDGYLSLKGMDALVRANLRVKRVEYFKKGQRPALRDYAHLHKGQKAVICLLGHFVYFDGRDYHSFFWNGGDPVVQAWVLKEEEL